MIPNEIRKKLQNIADGTCIGGATDYCTTVRNLLIKSFGTSPTIKAEFESKSIIKEKQNKFLRSWAKETHFWLENLPHGSLYLTKGGEAKVYLAPDKLNVIKLNDAVYYATWDEYLNSLTLHNLLFSNTAYSLIGFMEINNDLHAVLQQPFIEGEQAALKDIKELLNYNGFKNTKRQDYYNREFGLILEDMHDENVILKSNVLFFIDTVFYIT